MIEKPKLRMAGFYLTPENDAAIDRMASQRYKATGVKPRRSDIVNEAIEALYEAMKKSIAAE